MFDKDHAGDIPEGCSIVRKSTTLFRFFFKGALLALTAGCVGAQTRLDLQRQSRDADFSTASSTKSFRTGTVLPGTCSPGQTFFNSAAVAGANFYGCTSTNTWTLQGANASGPTLGGNNAWSGNNDFTAASAVSLPAPWVSTAVSNTYTAGAKQVFPPSATTAGLRIVGGSVPSAMTGGDLFVTATGLHGIFDGTNANLFPIVVGTGATPPGAPASGKCVEWGPGLSLVVAASNSACRTAPTPTDPVCAVTADIGKQWLDNTSSVTTHFKVCAAVASTPSWVTVF
jgi:hypothetical protein